MITGKHKYRRSILGVYVLQLEVWELQRRYMGLPEYGAVWRDATDADFMEFLKGEFVVDRPPARFERLGSNPPPPRDRPEPPPPPWPRDAAGKLIPPETSEDVLTG